MAAPRYEDWRIGPTELLEQAFHLLRVLTPGQLAPCLIGPVPFVLGLLFFWSDMTRAGGAAYSAPAWSLVLAVLYCWMKAWQAEFARMVWKRLLPEGAAARLSSGTWRQLCALWLLSALSLPLLFIAINVLVPFGWAYAACQNAVVLALTQDFGRRGLRGLSAASLKQSHHEPLQNHLILLLLMIFGVLIWTSVFQLAVLLPFLLRTLTGIETEFTRNPGAAFFNTLFLASTVTITYVLVSPFFRLVYILRNFYAHSRTSGADLLSRLHAIKRSSSVTAVAVALLVSPLAGQETIKAAAGPAPPPPPQHSRLGEAIRDTLSQREYQWKLPRDRASDGKTDQGFFVSFLRRTRDAVDGFLSDVYRTIRRWWEKIFGGGLPGSSVGGGGLNAGTLRGLVYLLTGVLALLLIGLAIAFFKRRNFRARTADANAEALPVDLESDETVASQLAEDQWLLLARDQMAAGDLRLAVRALFLATLASLAEQRLVEITRSKSNRDYREELQLRQRTRTQIVDAFGENIGIFERVWYGLHGAGNDLVEQLMSNYQRIKGEQPS
ncbi:MAG: hypothetical protein ACR2OZ_18150 [Verrucomicrobiales bacterium]